MINECVYKRNLEIESVEMGNEIGMLNIDNGKYYCLNEIGSEIWMSLEQPKTFTSIINHLLELFDIDEETCKIETTAFIDDLLNKNIIQLG